MTNTFTLDEKTLSDRFALYNALVLRRGQGKLANKYLKTIATYKESFSLIGVETKLLEDIDRYLLKVAAGVIEFDEGKYADFVVLFLKQIQTKFFAIMKEKKGTMEFEYIQFDAEFFGRKLEEYQKIDWSK